MERRVKLSSNMIKCISIYSGGQVKSSLQRNGTWSAVAWPPLRSCYRPAVFFLPLRLMALLFPQEKKIRHAYDKCHYFTFLNICKNYVIRRVSVLRNVGTRLPSDTAPYPSWNVGKRLPMDAALYPSWTKSSNHAAAKASELERKFVFVVNNVCKGGKICRLVLTL